MMSVVTITSAELHRELGRIKEVAQREAVSITSHGRESLVLLSAEEYRRLKAFDPRQAIHASELTAEELTALDEAKPPSAAARFNHELKF
jgi:prevent-host-death family protein